MRVALVVPTYNAGPRWREWLRALDAQTLRPDRLLLIDSSSEDDTVPLAREAGFEVRVIPREEFDHGGTRQLGVEWASDAEVVVFLSQDATFAAKDALEKITACFYNATVGAAYGRQLPYPDASPIETHARGFNYPPTSRLKGLDDAGALGFRTIFFSNAFGAYRQSVLQELGGFKAGTISMEDEYLAARIVLAGYKIAYCAEALAYHSHAYTLRQEFSRYFDFGVFHSRESWIRERFGQAEGEGMRFLRSQLGFLWRRQPSLVPLAMARMTVKLAGFRLGTLEKHLPVSLKRRMSMNKKYWDRHRD